MIDARKRPDRLLSIFGEDVYGRKSCTEEWCVGKKYVHGRD